MGKIVTGLSDMGIRMNRSVQDHELGPLGRILHPIDEEIRVFKY